VAWRTLAAAICRPEQAVLFHHSGGFGASQRVHQLSTERKHHRPICSRLAPPRLQALVLAGSGICLGPGRIANVFQRVTLFTCFLVLGLLTSCGGSSSGPPTPTPAGTFSFVVNGNSNGVTHSKAMVLVVK
jgi:hypothetical protein